ncbi:MAG: tRNA (adenosine(37)-N6)-dimethylallyltransferase MiaA [Desulfobacterium sp.]|nr:tRNA (adenosine(37)-N6)-dimethylallyltransferase MiaA [Desulfobacterium sp.]
MNKKKIVLVCGPTGIGKTGFAIDLALRVNGEIIGADSMQIYRYMDVGTAKPDHGERSMVFHHLVDVVDPDEDFDAARFTSLADSAIDQLLQKGRAAIVAGGTGFYFQALVHGLFRTAKANPAVVRAFEREAAGGVDLHARLLTVDPESAAKIHPNDLFRIIRALEVAVTHGTPISQLRQAHGFKGERYRTLKFGLYMDRENLYQRIEKRVDMMLDQGLIQEVKALVHRGYGLGLKSMQSIGYRHVGQYLQCETGFEEMVAQLKRDTRRYAKRQLTWFKRDKDMIWLMPHEIERAFSLTADFLKK